MQDLGFNLQHTVVIASSKRVLRRPSHVLPCAHVSTRTCDQKATSLSPCNVHQSIYNLAQYRCMYKVE
jgi:hypothetical protein